MLKLVADWEKSYLSTAEIEKDLSIRANSVDWDKGGWVEGPTDTLLVHVLETRKGKYHVQCWNGTGIRLAIGQLLGLPVQLTV